MPKGNGTLSFIAWGVKFKTHAMGSRLLHWLTWTIMFANCNRHSFHKQICIVTCTLYCSVIFYCARNPDVRASSSHITFYFCKTYYTGESHLVLLSGYIPFSSNWLRGISSCDKYFFLSLLPLIQLSIVKGHVISRKLTRLHYSQVYTNKFGRCMHLQRYIFFRIYICCVFVSIFAWFKFIFTPKELMILYNKSNFCPVPSDEFSRC